MKKSPMLIGRYSRRSNTREISTPLDMAQEVTLHAPRSPEYL
jgi:hypothetical protein